MKNGNLCSINIDAQEIVVRYLGKGKYSTVYRDEVNPEKVYIRASDLDDGKEIASKCKSIHIPRMEYLTEEVGQKGVSFTWYESKYVETISAASREAWEQGKLLRQIATNARNAQYGHSKSDFMYRVREDVYNLVEEQADSMIPGSLKDAIQQLKTWMSSYSDSAAFEFNKPNLGVTPDGLLILRDVVHCPHKH